MDSGLRPGPARGLSAGPFPKVLHVLGLDVTPGERLDVLCALLLMLDHRRLPHGGRRTQSPASQLALTAPPAHRQTYGLAVPNEEVVDVVPLVSGQPRFQSRPRLLWLGRLVPAPQVGDSMDVYIDTDALVSSPRRAHAQIGHLGAHAWERRQPLNGVGDVRLPLVPQYLGRLLDVLGLEVVEADLVDEGVQCPGVESEDGFQAETLRSSAGHATWLSSA